MLSTGAFLLVLVAGRGCGPPTRPDIFLCEEDGVEGTYGGALLIYIRPSASRLMSSALAEWVMAPIET